MQTNELTPQEICEGQALLAAWKNFCECEKDSFRIAKDSEEAVLNWYGKFSEDIAVPRQSINEIVCNAKKMAQKTNVWNAEMNVLCVARGVVRDVGEPPEWWRAKMDELNSDLASVVLKFGKTAPILAMLKKAFINFPPVAFDGLDFFNSLKDGIERVDDLCYAAQKNLRKLVLGQGTKLRECRGPMFDALKAWVGVSTARRDWLLENGGPAIDLPVHRPALFANGNGNGHSQKTVIVSRRRQKEQIAQLTPDEIRPVEVAEEEPWTVIFVRPSPAPSNELERVELVRKCENLAFAKALERYAMPNWPIATELTATKLFRLLDTLAKNRHNYNSLRLGGEKWYKLVFTDKYRMFAMVDDVERRVFVVLGNRNNLEPVLGLIIDEA